MLFENRGAWAPNCKGQYADTRWVMAYSHKTQSFMKNGGQLKCLDKALIRDHAFFISNARLNLAKNQANAKQQQLRLNFCYLKIIHILHPRYHPKIMGHILKKKEKSMFVCIHEIIWLIIVKMKIKMKNRSHRYHINSPRSRHIVNIRSVSVWWCLYVLSNIWSSIHEKVKQNWSWVEKKRCL